MKKVKIFSVFLACLLGLVLVSCNNGGGKTPATCTVSFNSNGGIDTVPVQTVTLGSSVTLPDGSGLTKDGFTFGGWNTKADGTGTNYSAVESYTPSGTITLYANWAVVGPIAADPTVTWPTGLTVMSGQTLSAISLPGNGTGTFTWTTPSAFVGRAGTRTHSMTFTPNDTANYNTITNSVAITVQYIPVPIEMVQVIGGTFTMGSSEANSSSNERPQRQVTLSAFSMGKYEVTQEQYAAVMGTNPSNFTSNAASGEIQSRRPVERVSWYDALVFCNSLSMLEGLTPAYSIGGKTDPDEWESSTAAWNSVVMAAGSNGYRLPTEAQWEYACRAGTTTAYNTGDTISNDTGWYSANSGSKTHEVGKKAANAWGLYDMHGNVWEWCWDRYGTYPSYAFETDPVGASSRPGRVGRGGSWLNSAEYVRSAFRIYDNPDFRYHILGFRLVRS